MRWEQNKEQKIQQTTDKKVEFQQDEHSEASEFNIMDWEYYKWNNNALFLECKQAWNPPPIMQRFIEVLTLQTHGCITKTALKKCYEREAALK